jgi:acyl-CoA reductase-like NAD-dependent aldehyde dehydrogenase
MQPKLRSYRSSRQHTNAVPESSGTRRLQRIGGDLAVDFPFAIICGMADAAVAGGNTVLLNPSHNTPVMAAEVVRLCLGASFPPAVFNRVTGSRLRGRQTAHRLAAD